MMQEDTGNKLCGSQDVRLYWLRWKIAAHCLKLYNNTVVQIIEERQQSTMVVAGSDLIAGHGGLQPLVEEADLWKERERGL